MGDRTRLCMDSRDATGARLCRVGRKTATLCKRTISKSTIDVYKDQPEAVDACVQVQGWDSWVKSGALRSSWGSPQTSSVREDARGTTGVYNVLRRGRSCWCCCAEDTWSSSFHLREYHRLNMQRKPFKLGNFPLTWSKQGCYPENYDIETHLIIVTVKKEFPSRSLIVTVKRNLPEGYLAHCNGPKAWQMNGAWALGRTRWPGQFRISCKDIKDILGYLAHKEMLKRTAKDRSSRWRRKRYADCSGQKR